MLNSVDTSNFFQNNNFFEKNYKSLALVLVNWKRNLSIGEKPFNWRETFRLERNLSIGEKPFDWRETFLIEKNFPNGGKVFQMEKNLLNGEIPF